MVPMIYPSAWAALSSCGLKYAATDPAKCTGSVREPSYGATLRRKKRLNSSTMKSLIAGCDECEDMNRHIEARKALGDVPR